MSGSRGYHGDERERLPNQLARDDDRGSHRGLRAERPVRPCLSGSLCKTGQGVRMGPIKQGGFRADPLLVLALSVVAVTGQAQATAPSVESFGPPFSTFADVGKFLCVGWPPPVRPQGGFTSALHFDEATKHAWVYGFVVGAAHVSEERLTRVQRGHR
jgi:hypothetical protein